MSSRNSSGANARRLAAFRSLLVTLSGEPTVQAWAMCPEPL